MKVEEYNVIREEFNNFPSSGVEFHHVDSDFLPDPNYRCIDLLKHEAYFPQSLEILRKNHSKLVQCFFAVLVGPKFVAPHKNKDKNDTNLRTHYGIIVHSKDDGVLNVGKKQYKWKENESFSFDTKKLHNVYKSKHYKRVILIVDS